LKVKYEHLRDIGDMRGKVDEIRMIDREIKGRLRSS